MYRRARSNGVAFKKFARLVLLPLNFAHRAGGKVSLDHLRVEETQPANADKRQRAFGYLRPQPA